jgi:predicted ABC-type ATPase
MKHLPKKSILREYIRNLLLESVSIPKVIFLAGAPGSGKSTVIRRLDLANKFEIVNPDDAYEEAKRRDNLPFDKTGILDKYKPIKDEYLAAVSGGDQEAIDRLEPEYLRLKAPLSADAKAFSMARTGASKRKKQLAAENKDFLVDGTGGNFNEINSQIKKLRDIGYETAMIYIDIDLETSIARNIDRGKRGGRRLSDRSVERSHAGVRGNKELYKDLFGKNFFYIDASPVGYEKSIKNVAQEINRFLR